MTRPIVRTRWTRILPVFLTLTLPFSAAAQNGQVTGTVTDAETGGPLATVQVYLQGTSYGGLSSTTGSFSLSNVPPGTYTLVAQRIGYQQTRQADLSVGPGATVTANLRMLPAVLALQGVVATGLVDPVEGVRAPIAVARVDRELMPVMASGAAVQSLQGRVAGMTVARRSGEPGAGVDIMLRTPTSLTGSGAPLIVVDGVILGGTGVASTVDIESMDIESVEVIRGAAASSLYGSRAASGVIAITTARGSSLPIGETRFVARTEYGVSQNMRNVGLNNSHHFLMDPTNSFYVDQNGNQVDRDDRVSPLLIRAFMDKPYPDPIYDNIGAITRAGGFMSNNLSVSGNTESTNFAVTLNNFTEEGSLVNNDGYERNSFRVNLDHRFIESLNLGTSVYHARDNRDNVSGSPFRDIQRGPRDIDLSIQDENGLFIQQPDPDIAFQNPLWNEQVEDDRTSGTRTLANLSLSWTPMAWMSVSGSVGYDRSENHTRTYTPKGTPNAVGSSGFSDGEISFSDSFRDTWNGEAQITFRRDFGPLNVRTTVRGLMERDRNESGTRSGENFILFDVPHLSNIAAEDRSASSSESEVRAIGYLWDTAFDYSGKYILTLLGRRDGSSLFGPDNRWHNYYRLAGAWRLAEEPWFNIPNLSEFKLSYARGTAGGRPGFSAQYETWELSGGIPTKDVLGNTRLAPEHTTEQEVSLNMVLFNRYGLVLTHAWQRTVDQLVQAPLANFTGFSDQWVNAGTVSGHTTEVEFEMQLIDKRSLGWNSMVVFDYSNSKIEDWPLPCQTPAWRFNCTGEPVYGIYSWWLIKDRAGLNRHRGGEAVPQADQFEVNDEGFLVWVGDSHYWEGAGSDGVLGNEDDLWGTTSGVIGTRTYNWGMPIAEQNAEFNNLRQLMGEANAVNFGWLHNVRLGPVNFHAQLQAAYGGDANNRHHQQLTNTSRATAPKMDQAGKPVGLKKPIQYFREANDGDASYYIEDASYLKLRTLSATYQMNREAIERFGFDRVGLQNLTIGLIARNIFTITNYDGFDPEQALNLNTRSNSDPGGYPPTRNLTAEVTVTF